MLLHGVATSRLVWRRVIGPLARGAARDRRRRPRLRRVGAGRPRVRARRGRRPAGRAGSSPDRFDLVGHSLGGAVAVATAARHPDAVRRLVLVAPAGLEPRATRVAAALGAAAERAVYARRAFGYQLAARARGRQAMFGATVADAGRLHPEDARLLLDASGGARRVAAGVRRALEADLRDDLAAAPMPVGLIWGTADRVVPYTGPGGAAAAAARRRSSRRSPRPATSRRSSAPPSSSRRSSGSWTRLARSVASGGVRRLLLLACAIVFVDTAFYSAITPLLPALRGRLRPVEVGRRRARRRVPGRHARRRDPGRLPRREGGRARDRPARPRPDGRRQRRVRVRRLDRGARRRAVRAGRRRRRLVGRRDGVGRERRAARPPRRDDRHGDGRGGRRRARRPRDRHARRRVGIAPTFTGVAVVGTLLDGLGAAHAARAARGHVDPARAASPRCATAASPAGSG